MHTYAEKFGILPQEVGAKVNVRWWLRYEALEMARTCRNAHELAARTEDWTTLDSEILDALQWARETEE